MKKHNIPVVHDLPGVGQHLVDHPVVDVYYANRSPVAKYVKPNSVSDVFKLLGATAKYFATRSGAMTTNVSAAPWP